jgi:Leucine-rich repeat (LRR) protein
MKHHFGDFLDRTGDYWTIVPNVNRYSFSADSKIKDKSKVKILTISKSDRHWTQAFDCPNIEEVTLHDPSKEQVEQIQQLKQLTRLRVTFFRAKDIEFIGNLHNLEEVVLEYVSGFSDMSPLQRLKKIKSLHFENLRRVSNFDGLRGLKSLRYLHIDGTLDWNQPIGNFEFVKGLPNLEVFSLGFVINKTEFPAFLPLLHLKKLKKLSIVRDTFKTNDFAFLQAAFPKVKGCEWDLFWDTGDRFTFLGKRAGFVFKKSPLLTEKREEFKKSFEKLKEEAKTMIKSYCG